MSVYNGERFLRNAIKSILKQTFYDFEFIIVDDGSTDNSFEIIRSYLDPRIRFMKNDTNIGLSRSLNKGLALSTGQYIARMDCDDISLPQRLEKQTNYLDLHPEIGICGSWIKLLDSTGETVWKVPSEDPQIRCQNLFTTSIAHPTAMMRKCLLVQNNLRYDESFEYAMDYDFWVRSSEVTRLANLEEVLLLYRIHSDRISGQIKKQTAYADKVRRYQLQKIGIIPTDEEINLHKDIIERKFKCTRYRLKFIDSWLHRLKVANKKQLFLPESSFEKFLSGLWDEHRNGTITKLRFLIEHGVEPTEEEFVLHRAIIDRNFSFTKNRLKQVEVWLQKLKQANEKSSFLPKPDASIFIDKLWLDHCLAANNFGILGFFKYWQSILCQKTGLNFYRKLHLFACFLLGKRIGQIVKIIKKATTEKWKRLSKIR